MRTGLVTGVLATICALPLTNDINSAGPPLPKDTPPAKNLTLTEKDFDSIQLLRKKAPKQDYHLQEIQWAEKVYPTVKEGLTALYKAEEEDIKALNKGTIKESERKVKICLTDFLRLGEEGDDMDMGPSLHVVKRYVHVQPDKTERVIYANERWMIVPETGAILPPEIIRVRAQAFKGSLYEAGADKLFVTDMLQLIWGRDDDNLKGGSIYPLLARQHFYGERGPKDTSSPINQTELLLSSPTSCVSCHVISPKNSHAKHLFNGGEPKRKINYGAITQDSDFDVPYEKQPGYTKYLKYLDEKVKKGDIKKEFADSAAKSLRNSRNLEVPYMIWALNETKNIPWLGSDIEVSGYDAGRYGFTYMDGKKEWEKAFYSHYKDQFFWLGLLWSRNDLAVIP